MLLFSRVDEGGKCWHLPMLFEVTRLLVSVQFLLDEMFSYSKELEAIPDDNSSHHIIVHIIVSYDIN